MMGGFTDGDAVEWDWTVPDVPAVEATAPPIM
jgi:hypothetical protein